MKDVIKGQIRQIVFGAEDGLVSIFGLVMGVMSTSVPNIVVGLAGLAGAFAGAISMAAGTFLASKSTKEIRDIEMGQEEADPHILEAINMCRSSGMTDAEIDKIKSLLMKEIEEEKVGAEKASPLTNALWIFFPYIIVSAAPIAPFFMIQERISASVLSVILTFFTLFIVGSLKTRFTKRNPFKAGLEMLLVGSLAAVLAYIVVLPFARGLDLG